MLEAFKWLLMSRYKKLIYNLETFIGSKRAFHIYTNKYDIRLDFKTMIIEVSDCVKNK